MQNTGIRKMIVAGGGTAGWLSAVYLKRALGDKVHITLIASEELGRIGVGEATIPTIRNTMRFLGFAEEEWMPRCNATYKMALRFVNWNYAPGTVEKDAYYHPFSHERDTVYPSYDAPFFPFIGEGLSEAYVWHKEKLEGNDSSYTESTHIEHSLCDQWKSPRVVNGKPQVTNYAYHFDAMKLAEFLREKAIERGVDFVDDMITEVKQHEDGNIRSLMTENHGEFDADFFIDCSGFRSIILGKTLNVPFDDYSDSLFMNSAVAVHRKNDAEEKGIPPYSNIVALSSGWSWDIPLFDRNGTGYVYSDKFITAEDAEKELRELMGGKCDGYTAKHLKFRVGKFESVWEKNCLAMGLAGSFLEPLESTAIFFTEFQLGLLVNHFPDLNTSDAVRNHYNEIFTEKFTEVRDFLIMHYVLTKREDTPFWRSVRNEAKIPDSVKEKLAYFKQHLPSMNGLKLSVFPPKSYTCILDGMGHLPEKPFPLMEFINMDQAEMKRKEFESLRSEIVGQQPDHYEWLQSLYKGRAVPA